TVRLLPRPDVPEGELGLGSETTVRHQRESPAGRCGHLEMAGTPPGDVEPRPLPQVAPDGRRVSVRRHAPGARILKTLETAAGSFEDVPVNVELGEEEQGACGG